MKSLDDSVDDSQPSVQGPRREPIAFVLREQLSQIFHSGGREGNRLLILGAMDPEATVLGVRTGLKDLEPASL